MKRDSAGAKPDKLDMQIVLLLQRDGRATNAQIARDLQVSEGTIRRRIDALTSAGVMKVVAITNPFAVGLSTPVLILLNVDVRAWESVAEALVQMPETRYVAHSTGEHDIVLEALFPSNHQLLVFLRDRLSKVPGITKVETSIQLDVLKRNYEWWMPGTEADELAAVSRSQGR